MNLKRNRLLTAWARLVCRHPIATLIVCVAMAGLSVWFTLARLQFQSDRSALIDPGLAWQQRYAEFKEKFPRWNDAVVVVDLERSSSRDAAMGFIAELEKKLKADHRFAAVTAGVPRLEVPPGMIYTQPIERVKQAVEMLHRTGPVLASPTLDGLLSLSELGGTRMSAEQREGFRGLLERAAQVGEGERSDVLGLDELRAVERLVTPSGKLATVLVSLGHVGAAANADEAVNTPAKGIAALREHLEALRSDSRFAGVQAGVTGVPVLESDETAQSLRDASKASIISLTLITLLMLMVYRGVVVPVFAIISLLIGMCWSFAWATGAVGHLQVLSVTFASLLLGLGIDVAIHIVARLELVHPDHDHLAPAIEQAFRGVGPGIITASITVAAAALAMSLTGFAGVGELGIIAAGGIVLCTLSIMCAFPAMLVLLPKPERSLRTREGGVKKPFMGNFGLAMDRHPWVLATIGIVLIVGAAFSATRVRYDTDLQKLMPEGVESVVWQNRLEGADARSVWHAVVVAKDVQQARELTERLRASGQVSEVGDVGMLFRSQAEDDAVQAMLHTLPTLPADGASAELHPERLRSIADALTKTWSGKDEAIHAAASKLASLDDAQLTKVQEAYRADRSALQAQVISLRSAEPITPTQLPQALKDLMVGTDGSLLLRVYPKDANDGSSPLAPARLNAFATAVLGAAPMATGPTVQIYESTRLINDAYLHAGLYALVAIVVLLLIDFGLTRDGVLDTMCALLPVIAGSVLLLGWMAVFGVALNFANMIVMPLIVGIGVGAGVHAVRRWRLQPNDPPLGLAGGSGRAIGLTTATTVIGFAAMMTAEHRGVRSLGFVMSVGLGMVWLTAIGLLPAVLRLRAGRSTDGGAVMTEAKAMETAEVGA